MNKCFVDKSFNNLIKSGYYEFRLNFPSKFYKREIRSPADHKNPNLKIPNALLVTSIAQSDFEVRRSASLPNHRLPSLGSDALFAKNWLVKLIFSFISRLSTNSCSNRMWQRERERIRSFGKTTGTPSHYKNVPKAKLR